MAQSDRVRVPLPFGQGLDRETGVMEVRPNSFEDLRNVLLYQGKLAVRSGFRETARFISPFGSAVTHILAGIDYPQASLGVVVTYEAAFGRVEVWTVDSTGTNPRYVPFVNLPTDPIPDPSDADSNWFDKLEDKETPPEIQIAEIAGIVYISHDTPDESKRAPTVRFNLVATGLPPFGEFITPLRLDTGTVDAEYPTWNYDGTKLDPTQDPPAPYPRESEIAYFRGIEQHLDYLVGWGFGGGDGTPGGRQARSEFIRISRPAQPDRFDDYGYFSVGSRNEPVRACLSYRGELLIFKAQEIYKLVGTERATFGVFGVDHVYGIIGSRLAIEIPEGVLFWSEAGPRITTGGPSEDLEIPLELEGYQPATLPTPSDYAGAFVYFIPSIRVVLFCFVDMAFALTVRTRGNWKWSYWEFGFPVYSGFTLYTGYGEAQPPEQGPYYDSVGDVAGTTAEVTYRHEDSQDRKVIRGDELVEFYVRPAGGDWPAVPALVEPVTFTTTQTFTLRGLAGGTNYEVRARYRRGGLFNENYAGSPSSWPPFSEATFLTTIDAPTITDAEWERIDPSNQQISFLLTPVPGLEAQDIEVYRDGLPIAVVPGPFPFTGVTYTDTTISGGSLYNYQAKTLGTGVDSPLSDPVLVWGGIPGIPAYGARGTFGVQWYCGWDIDAEGDPPGTDYTGYEVQQVDDWDGTEPTGNVDQIRNSHDINLFQGLSGTIPDPGLQLRGSTIETRLRYRKETGPSTGVYDFGQFSILKTIFWDDSYEPI